MSGDRWLAKQMMGILFHKVHIYEVTMIYTVTILQFYLLIIPQ